MKENEIEEGFWVFVSHSTKDFEKVRLVRNALEDSEFRPILFYLKCMENEDEINELLKREIDARRRFILCDSPNAQGSKFVQSEVDYIRSKKRMYEVIDLSQIDLGNPNVDKEVLELIHPFKRRTKVFLNFQHKDDDPGTLVKQQFERKGFSVVDSNTIFYDAWNNIPGGSASWAYDVDCLAKIFLRGEIETTLQDGYFVCLISQKSIESDYQLYEIEQALEIDFTRVLPVIIDDIAAGRLPVFLQEKRFLNLSDIASSEDKAKAIVDALIDFDLNNNK